MINLKAILPTKISDAEAYNLVNLMFDIATELNSYYATQIQNHIDKDSCCSPSLQNEPDEWWA